jgi:uncharacterized membrane protein YphA (DoxX/SURF4 family)
MNVLFFIGRIIFVLIFIFSGATKLMDIGGTAAMIAGKVTIPSELAGVASQLEGATGMSVPQLLAVLAGAVELVGGLLVAVNIGTRVATLLLIAFTAAATFYFHDFWNMAGGDRANNMVHALKNLSIIGALLVFFVLGSWRPAAESSDSAAAPRY